MKKYFKDILKDIDCNVIDEKINSKESVIFIKLLNNLQLKIHYLSSYDSYLLYTYYKRYTNSLKTSRTDYFGDFDKLLQDKFLSNNYSLNLQFKKKVLKNLLKELESISEYDLDTILEEELLKTL